MTGAPDHIGAALREAFPPPDDAPTAFPPIEGYPPHMRPAVRALRGRGRVRSAFGLVVSVVFHGCLLVLAAAVAWVLAMTLDRTPPMFVVDRIDPAGVRLGDRLLDRATVTARTRRCDLKLRWTILDGEREVHSYDLPTIPAAMLAEAGESFVRGFPVPPNLAPGLSTIRIARSYACPGNLLHQVWPITVATDELPFLILPRAP